MSIDLKEIEEVKEFSAKMIQKVKKKYGVDLRFGEISLIFHNGSCVRVMAEPKLRVCELQNDKPKSLQIARSAV